MNQCNFIGRLTKDLEVKYTMSGKAYARFSLAVPRRGKKEEADFINCLAWEKTAETISEWVGKGNKIMLGCSAQMNTYEKDGETRYSTDFVVREFEFLEYRNNSDNRTSSSVETAEPVDEDDDYPF